MKIFHKKDKKKLSLHLNKNNSNYVTSKCKYFLNKKTKNIVAHEKYNNFELFVVPNVNIISLKG